MLNISSLYYKTKLSMYFNTRNAPYFLFNNQITRKLLIDDVREKVKNRRLIFTISSGRAGSGFLADLLNSSSDIDAHHEPRPSMNGNYFRDFMNKDPHKTYESRKIKILGINRRLLQLKENTVYAETNHMFIKSFYDVVLDYYDNVEVIILRRELSKVLKSMIELRYFDDKNSHWRKWMYDINVNNRLTVPIRQIESLDQYDRSIAYLLDIEQRALKFKKEYPHVKTYEVDLDEVTTQEGAKKLFRLLNINWTSETDKIYQRRSNTRNDKKQLMNNPTSLQYCGERISKYLEEAHELKLSIPIVKSSYDNLNQGGG